MRIRSCDDRTIVLALIRIIPSRSEPQGRNAPSQDSLSQDLDRQSAEDGRSEFFPLIQPIIRQFSPSRPISKCFIIYSTCSITLKQFVAPMHLAQIDLRLGFARDQPL